MCGANDQQKEIGDQQQQMYKTLNDNYQKTFGQTQDILNALNAEFMPIMQQGPMQEGMTPEQKVAINAPQFQSINDNYAQAQRATAQLLAARGGGNTLLPSSVDANLLAQNAMASAKQRANVESNTLNQSYTLGRQNWTAATGVLSNVAQLTNPLGYAGASTSAGGAAATTANQIAQANNSVWNGAIGALGSLGGAALGNWGAIFPKGAPAASPGVINTQGIEQ
jgi:hypothetical protein